MDTRESRRAFAASAAMLAAAVLLAVLMLAAPVNAAAGAPAGRAAVSAAAAHHHHARVRVRAMRWARHRAGCRYHYGGRSCSPGFDCSGLVQRAYIHAGHWIPRTTYAMRRSHRLRRIPLRDARMGDLLFYGSGHVELKTRWHHVSFGAQQPGTRVGWHHWGGSWHPTRAYRVRT